MKFYNYVIIITGLALILELGGISISGFSKIIDLIGVSISSVVGFISATTGNSTLWLAVFGVGGVLALTLTAIGIGTLTRTTPENYIILPLITGTLYLFGSAFWGVANYAVQESSLVGGILSFIMIVLGVGFIISAVEFWRGTD